MKISDLKKSLFPTDEHFLKSNAQSPTLSKSGSAGFTLLELLVVVTILATVAFTASFYMKNAAEQAGDSLVLSEMQEIAKAIRQFKQDTGYYPKTGPFGLDDQGGQIDHTSMNVDWFYSPANLYQLTVRTSPLDRTGHLLETWNPESGRGWRGPYLTGHEDGELTIGDNINDGSAAGDPFGDPWSGDAIEDVPGIADPFEQKRAASELLHWEYDGVPYDYKGRPYLVFGLTNQPWIVSMGENGDYESTSRIAGGDDIILSID